MTSVRAQVVTRRTYNRPLNAEGTVFEDWGMTVDRVVEHQKWLWERALQRGLHLKEALELEEVRQLLMSRKASTSGRTLWLGGTDVAKKREASQFNCSFTHAETVQDIVDILWLLLQGCGVGFRPIVGQLTGFATRIEDVEVIRSERTTKGGEEFNTESFDPVTSTWTLRVGDSAEAWAKFMGKLAVHKYPARKLVLDFSQIRPAGERLAGYGWISSGDESLAKASVEIVKLMNRRAGQLMRRMDILDLVNWLGTVLSSRRSAEIALFAYGEDEWQEFAKAKDQWWVKNVQRSQSNNSLLFFKKPKKKQMREILDMMVEAGGSEPGFINGGAAALRAPWFKGVNPCAEILLGNKAFCNLVEVDVGKFDGDFLGLLRAIEVMARVCYRQTCVNLRDGVLQEQWHLNNEHLRLLGVGLTGIARRPDLSEHDIAMMQRSAIHGGFSMARELDLPLPKNVTTIKPSGTVSKIMDTTEGVHKPLGRFIFNNVAFSKHDPLVPKLREAGYRVFDHPTDPTAVLATMPVEWSDVPFDKVTKVIDGKPTVLEVNLESAITQLDRYLRYQTHWCQQNVSCTVSYSADEVDAIADWLDKNWDSYVGVSFLFRADPTKTAADLGYVYLPQEVVTEATFRDYVSQLQPLCLDDANSFDELVGEVCSTGACPTK